MLDFRSLTSASAKDQLRLIDELAAAGREGFDALQAFLLERRGSIDLAAGKAYQVLFAANQPETIAFLQTHFPQGVVPLNSDRNVDYWPLQQLLAQQEFEAADRLTLQKMCELAGSAAVQRKWLYFTEVERFPTVDLQTIDALWRLHSEGKFGFSVQREIWLSTGKNWDLVWDKIGWRSGNTWTRYPQEFTWNLSAPRGHLPLSNQLRGVRTIAALMAHPAWTS
ncbi:GUN4 N-terminal ARM-like repeat domain-containing protein [Microcoleus sp. FACHB-1515]|uniref:GUN4 domain-containing protein n=1 Tax=Cyanophyceae TaxID=3028117 RepID=UPI0016834D9B|nr:GUN4 domain-containing protein [Microcoleus sp. FACHB-1515]MBD2092418.1 GUN4 N-terminal ARM-like repeat domain-containing protein [Microcoleus sp. FACHB-1515]